MNLAGVDVRRELTPAQHAAIRRQLALIPVYVWLFYAWLFTIKGLPLVDHGPTKGLSRDFAHFYLLGFIANTHDLHALYDPDAQVTLMKRVVPVEIPVRFPTSHGPQMALLFAPLARLPYVVAICLWLALTVVLFVACGYSLWRACPRLRDERWTAFWLLAATPSLYFTFSFGQTAAVMLLAVTLAFFALRAHRRFLAGLAISVLFLKPQLGLAFAFVFLFAGEWRFVLGALTGVAIQLGAGMAYWGPGVLISYAQALGRLPGVMHEIEPAKGFLHSWRSFFQLLGLPNGAVVVATVVCSVFTAIVAWACWRARGPLALKFAVLLMASVLMDLHLYVYDFILLTPAFLLLWDWSLEDEKRVVADILPFVSGTAIGRASYRPAFQALLYFAFMAPILGPAAEGAHVQFTVVAIVLIGTVVVRQLWWTNKDDTHVLLRQRSTSLEF